MAEELPGFKRVNFFTGFQTTAEDWNELVRYDVEKHKLHNRLFHGPGVLVGELSALKVTARGRGDLSVEISPGYAMDGEGNDIYLGAPEIKTIDPGDFKLPQTVYIVIKYVEDLTDFVSYRANLEYKGHRRVAEKVKLEAIITEPASWVCKRTMHSVGGQTAPVKSKVDEELESLSERFVKLEDEKAALCWYLYVGYIEM